MSGAGGKITIIGNRLTLATYAFLRGFFYELFPPRPQRIELKCVTYAEGDRLIRSSDALEKQCGERWRLAKEEDDNRNFALVYVERVKMPQRRAL